MRLQLPPIAPVAALAAAALAVAAPAHADEAGVPAAASPAPPRLIVAIAVDQLGSDIFQQYRERFSDGIGRLLSGAVFPSGFQSHAATETCPGHSTLMTGAHPSRTGIVANDWFAPALGRDVYCVEDENDPASTKDAPVVSPDHLLVPTLGDLLKRKNPASRNVAVSGKDRAAVMMSGHDTDAVYWWRDKGFATFAGRELLPTVAAGNAQLQAMIDAGAPALSPPDWCGKVDRATDVGGFTIGTYRFPLASGDYKGFGNSPRIDLATTAMAIRLVDAMKLGQDAVPDVLSVSYSATDKVGHAFGNEGVEMCIQMNQLDQTVGTLLSALDARGLNYVVVLTADHGGTDAPERMKLAGYPAAQRLDPSLTDKALSASVAAATGITVPQGRLFYGAGASGDVWLNAGLTGEAREKAIAELVRQLRANPQIAAAYTADDLKGVKLPAGNPQDWTMIERVAGSYHPGRSGEVLMMTKRAVVPGTAPRPGYTSTHGSPWDYDRRVPMIFWRPGLPSMEQAQPVETVDIAPTLAALVGLSAPEGTWDGRCLDIDAGTGDICPR